VPDRNPSSFSEHSSLLFYSKARVNTGADETGDPRCVSDHIHDRRPISYPQNIARVTFSSSSTRLLPLPDFLSVGHNHAAKILSSIPKDSILCFKFLATAF